MPQAQGQIVPAAALLPTGIDLNCNESDTELFEDDQAALPSPTQGHHVFNDYSDLPLSQGSCSSQTSHVSSASSQSKTDLEYLMDAVQQHHAELTKVPQIPPRSKTPIPEDSEPLDYSTKSDSVTPMKSSSDSPDLDPLTPTANLKMLMDAVSPELRNREKVQRELAKSLPFEVKIKDVAIFNFVRFISIDAFIPDIYKFIIVPA